MATGILGKKLGMSQVFDEKNRVIPVTFIEAGPCVILSKKTEEKNKYEAVQLGFDKMNARLINKPMAGQLKKINAEPVRFIREIRGHFEEEPGSSIYVDIFKEGDYVDVTGISKGKGFAGGMKRWGWAGGGASHGSMSHRRVGAIGCRLTPGRVFKGKTMPGRMGNKKVSVQNLKVIKVDREKNLLVVKGAVPGVKNGYVIIRKSIKKVQ